MIERQHAQLIAGLQELYRCTQNGQGWGQAPLELVNNGRPLTHKILEGLGVLRTDEWDDNRDPGGMPAWTSFEQQGQDGSSIMYDASQTPSPTSVPTSPLASAVQCPFPKSTIMAKRMSKSDLPTSRPSNTPSMTDPHLSNPLTLPYSIHSNLLKSNSYDTNLYLQIPANFTGYNSSKSRSSQPDIIDPVGDQNSSLQDMGWMSSFNDVLDPPVYQDLTPEVQ